MSSASSPKCEYSRSNWKLETAQTDNRLLAENSGESCWFDRDRNAAAYFCSALGL